MTDMIERKFPDAGEERLRHYREIVRSMRALGLSANEAMQQLLKWHDTVAYMRDTFVYLERELYQKPSIMRPQAGKLKPPFFATRDQRPIYARKQPRGRSGKGNKC